MLRQIAGPAALLLLGAAACTPEAEPWPGGGGGSGGRDDDTATGGEDTGSGSGGGDDTGEEVPESCGFVRFTTESSGEEVDLTEAFSTGQEVLLDEDGHLEVCTGTWFSLLTVEASVSITGSGSRPGHTVLSGGESGTVVVVQGAGAAVALSQLTLDRGAARGEGNQERGGGLRCEEGARVTLADVVLSDNTAYDGGGLFAGQGCTVVGSGVRFTGNSTEDDGGAFRAEGAEVSLSGATFEDNDGRDGGVMIAWESVVALAGSTFAGNRSRDSQGGALLHYDGVLTVEDSRFEGNEALTVGGAASVFGEASFRRVDFVGNTATEGGALYVYPAYGTLACEDCSFSGNAPDDVGVEGVGSYDYEGAGEVGFVCDGAGCG